MGFGLLLYLKPVAAKGRMTESASVVRAIALLLWIWMLRVGLLIWCRPQQSSAIKLDIAKLVAAMPIKAECWLIAWSQLPLGQDFQSWIA